MDEKDAFRFGDQDITLYDKIPAGYQDITRLDITLNERIPAGPSGRASVRQCSYSHVI